MAAATNGYEHHGVNGESKVGSRDAYHYSKHYRGKPRPLRIVVIGCGVSGIAAVKMFKDRFAGQPVEMVIYEKNTSIGGTWFENRYPGCSCDVPSHTYTYSWEGNPYWSRVYVDSTELYNYFTDRAKIYGVDEYVRLQHRVTEAHWNETTGQYKLTIEDLANGKTLTDKAEVVISATGILNSWKWPDLPGIQDFKGILLHSAHYDTTAKLDGKVVGVIGTGSSGIQIVPHVQRVAKHLHTFHRSSTYITPELALELAPKGRDTIYSEEQQQRWAENPEEFLQFRKRAAHILNSGFEVIYKDSEEQKENLQKIRKQMAQRLSRKPELIPLLVPDFALGCRRFTPGDGYLEALCEDNVTVRKQPISKVVADGIIMDDGTKVELDVLICATGFNTSFLPPFKLIGEDGAVLNEMWKEEPRGYLGVAAPKFPNYFMVAGPNSPAAHGTLVSCLEAYVNYAFNVAEKLMTEHIKSITVKQEAVDDFQEHKDDIVKDLVWTSSCRSWYKNGTVDGKVWGPWPGSGPHFLESFAQIRWEDFNFKYHSSNRFQFFGNGRILREFNGGDLAWFITDDKLSKPKRDSKMASYSVREQLIGAWELVSYTATLLSDESNVIHPMGPNATGSITYSSDGYVSAQLSRPDQGVFDRWNGSDADWARVGHSFISYFGPFYVDEEGDEQGRPILLHTMRVASLPHLRGDVQRRLVSFSDEADGKHLIIEVDREQMGSEYRKTKVQWRRAAYNDRPRP